MVPRKKILIIEDNEDILEVLTDWLRTIDYDVAAHRQVHNIITLAEQVRPDLVLLDYILEGINGGEYCVQLKKNPKTQHLPVIMLSAHQRMIDSLGHYGWDAFVAKPFDLNELAEHIHQLTANDQPV